MGSDDDDPVLSADPTAPSTFHPAYGWAAGVVLAIATALALASCGPTRYSHLDVYNRTTVPIVFSVVSEDFYVPACSDGHFIYGAGTHAWDAVDPSTQPSPAPTDAVRVLIRPVGPPADGTMDTAWMVTKTGLSGPGVSSALPSCEGIAPTPKPGEYVPPVPSLTDAETAWCLADPHWVVDVPRAAASLGLRMTDYYAEASAAVNASPRGDYSYERAALDAQEDVNWIWACDAAFAANH